MTKKKHTGNYDNDELLKKSKNNYENEDIANEFFKKFKSSPNSISIEQYFKKLTPDEQKLHLSNLKSIYKDCPDVKPNLIKILEMNTTPKNIFNMIESLKKSEKEDMPKYKNYINTMMKIPIGQYKTRSNIDIPNHINAIKTEFNNIVYGHEESKNYALKLILQSINNPNNKIGNVFGLCGPPGTGKTSMAEIFAKAFDVPFNFINLSGITNGSYLVGHSYTYEGSKNGIIVDKLIESKCMNPLFFFDELDKVSLTNDGREIINLLIHMTDPTNNTMFNDKYFSNIDIDLSKAIFVFSFNDKQNISPILLDRIKMIKINGYTTDEKIKITKEYTLPKLYLECRIDNKFVFPDDVIKFIINNYTLEGGIRKLNEILFDILCELNLRKVIHNKSIKKLTINYITDDLLKSKRCISNVQIDPISKIGIMNGLYATDAGYGSILKIQAVKVYEQNANLSIVNTGSLRDVIKESIQVARTFVLTHLNRKYIDYNRDYKIHIHFPDGATPKDGPSAGCAIAICLISLLTKRSIKNNIAMTGEIDMYGNSLAVGGLEHKFDGAKKSGVNIVYYPKQNEKDVQIILDKHTNLVDDNFKLIPVDNISDIIKDNHIFEAKNNSLGFSGSDLFELA